VIYIEVTREREEKEGNEGEERKGSSSGC